MDGRHLQPSFAHANVELPVFFLFLQIVHAFFLKNTFLDLFFFSVAGLRIGTTRLLNVCCKKKKKEKKATRPKIIIVKTESWQDSSSCFYPMSLYAALKKTTTLNALLYSGPEITHSASNLYLNIKYFRLQTWTSGYWSE